MVGSSSVNCTVLHIEWCFSAESMLCHQFSASSFGEVKHIFNGCFVFIMAKHQRFSHGLDVAHFVVVFRWLVIVKLTNMYFRMECCLRCLERYSILSSSKNIIYIRVCN